MLDAKDLVMMFDGFMTSLLQCDVPEGGIVPKSLYAVEDDMEKDRSPEDSHFRSDSLYHTAYVHKDFPHEVSVLVELQGTIVSFSFLKCLFHIIIFDHNVMLQYTMALSIK